MRPRSEKCGLVVWSVQRNSAVKSGVLLECPGGTVAGAGIGGTEHLLQCAAANYFPDFFEIFGKRNSAPVGGLDIRISTKDFEGRANTGKNEVCATHAFAL